MDTTEGTHMIYLTTLFDQATTDNLQELVAYAPAERMVSFEEYLNSTILVPERSCTIVFGESQAFPPELDASTSNNRLPVEYFLPTFAEAGSSVDNAESSELSDADSTFSNLSGEPSNPLTEVNAEVVQRYQKMPKVGCARTNWIFNDHSLQFRQEVVIQQTSPQHRNDSNRREAPSTSPQPCIIYLMEPETVSEDCAQIDGVFEMCSDSDEDEELPSCPTGDVRKRRVRYPKEEYLCKICEYKCTVEASLTRHVKSHLELTNVELMFSCQICGLDSESEYANSVHLTTHKHGQDYKCDFCLMTFRLLKKLIQHRRKHTQEKPHRCHICSFRSTRRDNLHSHARRKHNIPRMETDTFTQPYIDWAAISLSACMDFNNNNYF